MTQVLRPLPLSRDSRQHVAHIFAEDDLWFPYRLTRCGKEIASDRLVEHGVSTVCSQCLRLSRAG